ncbi:DUF2958 domain-containing protein [bacterium]|nr:DUF2958 domain-containing protein [bacterium]
MKLITPEFEALFKDYPLYSQEHAKDPLIICKLFDPCWSATWFLLEYDPVEKIAFCYVTGLDEFGYTSLIELESIERPFGLTIEQDLYFAQKRLSEVKKLIGVRKQRLSLFSMIYFFLSSVKSSKIA